MLKQTHIVPIRLLVPVLAALSYVLAYLGFLHSRSPQGFEWVNHDVATTLYIGRALLEGKRLYIDILETNPPTIVFISAAVVRLCQALGLSPIAGYHGLVLLIALAGTMAVQRACRRASTVTTSLLGLAYAVIAIGCGAPGAGELLYAFGQREHLFVLVFVPYLVWRLSRGSVGRTEPVMAFAVGICASQKPQFASLVVVFEIILATRARGATLRLWLALAVGIVLPYALLAMLCPASIVNLWEVIVPIHTGGTYAAFNGVYRDYVASAPHTWLCIYGAALGYFAWPLWRNPLLERRWRISIVVLLPLAYANVILQGKYWGYHSIPLLGLTITFATYLASLQIPLLPRHRSRALLRLTAFAAMVALGVALVNRRQVLVRWKQGLGECAYLLKLVPILQQRRDVLYFSTSIEHMRLAEYMGQRTVGRYCHNFDYPALVHEVDPKRRERLLSEYCARQADLIRTARPSAIVFSPANQALKRTDPTMHELLVRRCQVIPMDSYDAAVVPDLAGAFVYLRH